MIKYRFKYRFNKNKILGKNLLTVFGVVIQ
jgi:hypothetical protein